MKKPKKFVRAAGGQVWQDDSLLEWDPSKPQLITRPFRDALIVLSHCRRLPHLLRRPRQRRDGRGAGPRVRPLPVVPEGEGGARPPLEQNERLRLRELQGPGRLHTRHEGDER